MLKKRKPFYFVRHGETDFNRTGLFVGRTDVTLNAAGRVQAHQAAKILKHYSVAVIACSPLLRAYETAQIIGTYAGIIPVVVPQLQECSFGVMEGKPYSSTFFEYLRRWRGGKTFDGAESYKDFFNRVLRGVDLALEHEGLVLVVAHGAVGTTLSHALGYSNIEFDNGIPHRFEPHEQHDKRWCIERLCLSTRDKTT